LLWIEPFPRLDLRDEDLAGDLPLLLLEGDGGDDNDDEDDDDEDAGDCIAMSLVPCCDVDVDRSLQWKGNGEYLLRFALWLRKALES
jgi:GNAT superfamily N-acetyltransferase